jgi:solute carrier family 35 protein E3
MLQAAVMLGMLVPMLEPLGLRQREPGTILGYHYTHAAVAAILGSAVLGLLVSLSTFLVIGATSSLSYNGAWSVKCPTCMGIQPMEDTPRVPG